MIIIYLSVIPVMFLDHSIVEWIGHFVMHLRKLINFPIIGALVRDHQNHHKYYSGNNIECHAQDDHGHEKCFGVTQFLWVGVLLTFVAAIPFLILESLTSFKYHLSIIAAVSWYAHYLLFEVFHNAIHRPLAWQRTAAEKSRVYDFIYRHHALHHTKKASAHYGGIYPIADILFGTDLWVTDKKIILICRVSAIALVSTFVAIYLINQ